MPGIEIYYSKYFSGTGEPVPYYEKISTKISVNCATKNRRKRRKAKETEVQIEK